MLDTLTKTDLVKVLRDYNNKLQQKKYKLKGMKKGEVVAEIKKMYSWKSTDKKISFLRKGKQHSYILHLKGSVKRTKQDEERKKKLEKRRMLIKKNKEKKTATAEKKKQIILSSRNSYAEK